MKSFSPTRIVLHSRSLVALALSGLLIVWTSGCHQRQQITFNPSIAPTRNYLQQIEYPDLDDETDVDGTHLMSPPPMTISQFQQLEPLELTIDQCIEQALANSKVMQKLGGVVVSSPQAASTLYDQAIRETNPLQSPEAALAAFDAQFNSNFLLTHSESPNVGATALFGSTKQDGGLINMALSKQTASGAQFTLRSNTDYTRLGTASPFQPFRSFWNINNSMEIRQPLMRNRGAQVNRIAGPNALPGNYNGVMIARIRSDISLADFEAAVRNLVRDVESSYWELYFGYRDLDTKLAARDAARETWENRKLRYENGVGRPDDEAQARQQYFNFQSQVQNALAGTGAGQQGVLGAERNLRRLLGMPVNDGKIIRPISEPVTAPIAFNWEDSQMQTLGRRVELRKQKWVIRQRELELIAAKQLNKWRLDLVGSYNFKGFGDNLFGSRSRPNGSAFDDLLGGQLDDWQLGIEYGGAIGNRQGHLAIRNAELNLRRERVLLDEQQRQLLHDLSAAFTEVDRAFEAMRVAFNQQVAVQEELEPKRKRVEEGQDTVFFLLDVQQRAATAESAVYRAIVNYNIALMNYAYTTGSLLSRYHVYLTEGPWYGDAEVNASVKAGRLAPSNNRWKTKVVSPVTAGPYDQSLPGPMSMTPVETESLPLEPTAPPAPSSGDDQESNDLKNDGSIDAKPSPSLESPPPSPPKPDDASTSSRTDQPAAIRPTQVGHPQDTPAQDTQPMIFDLPDFTPNDQ